MGGRCFPLRRVKFLCPMFCFFDTIPPCHSPPGSGLTLAKWHRSIPLIDPLWGARAGGSTLANETEALVTVESQGAAQLSACLTVHRTIHRVVGRAAVGRCEKHEHIKDFIPIRFCICSNKLRYMLYVSFQHTVKEVTRCSLLSI